MGGRFEKEAERFWRRGPIEPASLQDTRYEPEKGSLFRAEGHSPGPEVAICVVLLQLSRERVSGTDTDAREGALICGADQNIETGCIQLCAPFLLSDESPGDHHTATGPFRFGDDFYAIGISVGKKGAK